MLHAIIMAGGSGTRFWPASRATSPKQLLNLVGDQTMLQATIQRLGQLIPPERVLIVTNERLVQLVAEQLPQLPADAVVGEPCKRDTAPCIGLAAGWVSRSDPDATMVVLPADHVIGPVPQFHLAIEHAGRLVDERPDRLVTFGIRPTYAAEFVRIHRVGRDAALGQRDPRRRRPPIPFAGSTRNPKPKLPAGTWKQETTCGIPGSLSGKRVLF